MRKNRNDINSKGPFSPLHTCLSKINPKLADCPDVIRKKVFINDKEAYFLYIEELADKDLLQRDFIQPIIAMNFDELSDEKNILNLSAHSITIFDDPDQVIDEVTVGNSVFICDGLPYAISCKLKKVVTRSIDEPVIEKNIRGPHEGFIEDLATNLSILRKKIKNSNLKFKEIKLGQVTNQTVIIAYIEGIANLKLVEKLYNKIHKINFDGLLAVGYIEQAITDFPNSIFPQYHATERPDKVVAGLLEGKITILLDGTPVTLVVPVSFFSFFQALDDYSTQWIHGSFLRFLRITALFLALLLPSFYIAVTSFHYYAVPLNLLVPLAESRAKVPFPPIIEILILELTVEMVREAAIRLPTYIGTAISVVAGLIIGQAAVDAGVVSDLLIVIVASTAIASYVIPSYDMSLAIRILRFWFAIAAAIFGMIGIVVCFSLTMGHLVTLESLGQPYFQPIVPLKMSDLKDTIFRFPLRFLRKRSDIGKPYNKKRGR